MDGAEGTNDARGPACPTATTSAAAPALLPVPPPARPTERVARGRAWPTATAAAGASAAPARPRERVARGRPFSAATVATGAPIAPTPARLPEGVADDGERWQRPPVGRRLGGRAVRLGSRGARRQRADRRRGARVPTVAPALGHDAGVAERRDQQDGARGAGDATRPDPLAATGAAVLPGNNVTTPITVTVAVAPRRGLHDRPVGPPDHHRRRRPRAADDPGGLVAVPPPAPGHRIGPRCLTAGLRRGPARRGPGRRPARPARPRCAGAGCTSRRDRCGREPRS
jgi:hypothetical protein